MGILKTLFLITTPIAGLTFLAFRLGHKLPVASRLFGNYIGMSYVYFKTLLKILKPVDQVPFEVISLARKTSQQSQALRRQLKTTLKRAQQEVKRKREETFQDFGNKVQPVQNWMKSEQEQQLKEEKRVKSQKEERGGSQMLAQIMRRREQLLLTREGKKKSSKFYETL